MFLIVFSLALLIANIYFFINRKYLYLFIPCMLFLPEYYGLEVSRSLPILTVTRMMFLVFYVYVFINKRRNLSSILKDFNLKKCSKPALFVIGYFVLRLIPNICYITTTGQALKTIFNIIFEEALLLIALYLLDLSGEEILALIKVVVYVSTVFFVLGIFESFTFIKIFDQLYTVSRTMLNEYYVRLGMLRATTSLALPILYGNMCLFMFPFIAFLYEKTRQKRYLLIAFLNVVALIHSGCRADLFFYIFILFIYIVFVVITKARKLLCLKNTAIVFAAVMLFIVTLSVSSSSYRYFYTGTVKSVLNEVGFDFDLSEDAPEGSGGYGGNDNYGSGSRIAHFTGILYTLRTSPVIGLGSRAATRGEIQYYSAGFWHPSYICDVGYVEIFGDEGIIGFLGYACLFIALILASIKPSIQQFYETHSNYKLFIVITYLLGMLSTANMYAFLMVIAFFSLCYNEENS